MDLDPGFDDEFSSRSGELSNHFLEVMAFLCLKMSSDELAQWCASNLL